MPTPPPKAEIKIGQTAIAVGRTLAGNVDEPPSVSVGIISALNRIWGKAVQTDAKISPTNYGGPLSICTAACRASWCRRRRAPRARRPASSGTTPASASPFRWKTSTPSCRGSRRARTCKRGILGVTMQGQDEFGAAPTVATVAPGSPAEKAGVKPGDLIMDIDGKPVASQAQLHAPARHAATRATRRRQARARQGRGDSSTTVMLGGAAAAFGQAFLGILPVRDDPEPGRRGPLRLSRKARPTRPASRPATAS